MPSHIASVPSAAVWASRRPRSGEGFCAALNGGFINTRSAEPGVNLCNGECPWGRGNIEADGAHALAEIIARDVVTRESRELGIDLNQGEGDILHATRHSQPGGAHT